MSSQRSSARSGAGGAEPHQRRPGVGDEAGQVADADARLHRLGQAEHGVDPVGDPLGRDVLAQIPRRVHRAEILAEPHPAPLLEA